MENVYALYYKIKWKWLQPIPQGLGLKFFLTPACFVQLQWTQWIRISTKIGCIEGDRSFDGDMGGGFRDIFLFLFFLIAINEERGEKSVSLMPILRVIFCKITLWIYVRLFACYNLKWLSKVP